MTTPTGGADGGDPDEPITAGDDGTTSETGPGTAAEAVATTAAAVAAPGAAQR